MPVSDVVLVSIIGAVSTIAVAVVAQVIGLLTATKQAERIALQEEAKHRRERANSTRAERKAALGQILKQVEAVNRAFEVFNIGDRVPPLVHQPASEGDLVVRIATLELPALRPLALEFQAATREFQEATYDMNGLQEQVQRMSRASQAYKAASKSMLDAIANEAEAIQNQ